MATKKSTPTSEGMNADHPQAVGDVQQQIEDRRKRKREAVTVDGTESFPPPGMDLADGGMVPLDEGEQA